MKELLFLKKSKKTPQFWSIWEQEAAEDVVGGRQRWVAIASWAGCFGHLAL